VARISLREYTRQIERIIENGQGFDEAIAHCRHILKTFPKYLEAYRLLGKAYLEAKRYSEAVDIFQRLLIAVPDDFVAHVGMSIIADDQGKLDDAIWHMERAFEVQPANAAIQAELQRLFGRRDGVEPPKIRLTRGALARMYLQGELYPQAISEARAVLADDSQRADIQVLLARAYFQNGQKREASELCSQLLKRFPYCFEANRILVELLPAAPQRSDSIPVYRHRVTELDPYAAFAQGSLFNSDEVPDEAVTLERLEYAAQTMEMGAAWGVPRGGLTGVPEGEAPQPDWLKSAAPTPEPPPTPMAETPIPDFLRQAGWSEVGNEAQAKEAEASPLLTENEALPGAIEAELPEWIKSIAPSAEESAEEPSPEIPAWFKGLGAQEPPEPPPISPPRRAPPLDAEPQAPETPDWLRGPEAQPSSSAFPMPPSAQAPPRAPAPEEQPERPPAVEAPPAASAWGSLGTSAQEQDDALAWLESLAVKHGAKPEELVTDPNARTGTPPEWVNRAREIGEAAPAPVAPEDRTGMWLKELEAQEAAPSVPPSVPSPQERSSQATGTEVPAPKPLPEQEEERASAEVPEWLGALESSPAPPSPAEEEAPSWLGTLETPSVPPPPLPVEEEEAPSWLRPGGPPPEEQSPAMPSPSSASTAGLPDWLAGLDREEPAAPSPETVPPWLEVEAEPRTTQRARPADWRPLVEPPLDQPPAPPPQPAPVERSAPPEEKKTPSPPPRSPSTAAPSAEAGETLLEAASAELGRGNIAAALQTYNRLIRKGKMLDEIIRQLREALYRYPVDVPLWQALGDAYMRANRLQEALDAYTKAEELLR